MAKIPVNSYMNFCDFFEYEEETFFDTPDFPEIPESDKDVIIEVTNRYMGRLDLIAHDYYRDSSLWWVIALANDLKVVPDGMRLNMRLRIPQIATVRQFLTRA